MRKETHARDSQIRNELADGVPKALASFAVGEPEAAALERMVDDLTRPAVAERVKDQHCEEYPVEVSVQESELDAGAVKLACYIVQHADPNVGGEVLEKRFQQNKRVVLFLAGAAHVDQPEDAVMAAEKPHYTRIVEELRAGLLVFVVGGLERGFALV